MSLILPGNGRHPARLPPFSTICRCRFIVGFGEFEDTTDDHGATILDQYLGLHVLGVDCEAGGRCLAPEYRPAPPQRVAA